MRVISRSELDSLSLMLYGTPSDTAMALAIINSALIEGINKPSAKHLYKKIGSMHINNPLGEEIMDTYRKLFKAISE